MQKIVDFEKCSGCHACFNACPKNCISMKPDEEGFLYPEIDNEKCIDCGMCQRVCPVLTKYKGYPKGNAYACINKSDETRKFSSSGGIFSLLAEHIISQDGVVFGAAFDNDLNVCHMGIRDIDELKKLQGSKYVQSKIGDTYKQAREYLEAGKKVLFSGTPCQISGLLTFLGKDYENLVCQDIVCHGVPSPLVWKEYLKFVENQIGAKAKKVTFRDKSYGWKRYFVRLDFDKEKKYTQPFNRNLFMKGFLENLYLRPSCYDCHSKSVERQSDITLADFWGIEKIHPEFFDNKGTSLVLENSEKGRQLINAISSKMHHKKVDIDSALKFNPSAYRSACIPKNRKRFMKLLCAVSFKKAIKRNVNNKFIKRCTNFIKRSLLKVIK